MPELERGRRHEGSQFAAFQSLFGGEPELLRHAAVMRGDGLFAETIAELARDALGHAPCVDEHQRRAMLRDKLDQARVNFPPHLVRHHRLERRTRNFEAQVAPALMSRVDDRNLQGGLPSAAAPARKCATDSIGFCVADRPMRCRRSPQSAASLSSDKARWAPRLFGATAWISSTITDRALASIARPDCEPSST